MALTRIFYGDNGVLTDFTDELSKFATEEKTIPAWEGANDFLYLGMHHPFNHFYLKLGTIKNVVTAAMQVEYWDGDEWIQVVEIRDRTNGFKNDGFVTFTPNDRQGWASDDTADKNDDNSLTPEIPDLGTVVVYDRYWIRISLNADLTVNTAVKWIGNKFSDDNDLAAVKSSLTRQVWRDMFTPGSVGTKLDWEEQHVYAAELIVEDLIDAGTIWSKGQILSREKFKHASVQKVAEIIYDEGGPNHVDQRDSARQEYLDRIQNIKPEVDENKDGILQPSEVQSSQEFMSR